MADTTEADALQAQIEEASNRGDHGEASRLYRQQQGMSDPYGLEPAAETAVAEVEPSTQEQPATSEALVSTGAGDEIVSITGGLDFVGNAAHVNQALDAMSHWDQNEAGEMVGDSVATLKAKWGSDLPANLQHFQNFAAAHSDIQELLEGAGLAGHPAIVEAGAMLGRRYATTAGDPSEITTRKGDSKMSSTETENIEAQIDALQGEIDQATGRFDRGKAQELYLRQQELFRRLPGGSDPAVGSAGRSV